VLACHHRPALRRRQRVQLLPEQRGGSVGIDEKLVEQRRERGCVECRHENLSKGWASKFEVGQPGDPRRRVIAANSGRLRYAERSPLPASAVASMLA
jgi:hypothetical protein